MSDINRDMPPQTSKSADGSSVLFLYPPLMDSCTSLKMMDGCLLNGWIVGYKKSFIKILIKRLINKNIKIETVNMLLSCV